ncbi:Shedu immune nuclease family protein [Bathymodiolus japonicus methanotrophic gill symbiont]|uniref:Shedu immune nuclease family protein n=1 Tax=Bathymodiolus japonicus methanotrophic gill symbiont TaxID=113269 RepID=UPI001E4A0DB3|nr:Shedu immune nuclease family protein [Bathymodiolus japonicus methanotrophic gill symbiont]
MYEGSAWLYERIKEKERAHLCKTFYFTKNELVSSFDKYNEYDPVEFEVAKKKQGYYCFPKDLLCLDYDLYIHEDIKLEKKMFVTHLNISIFLKINKIINGSIYIGGEEENSIPESVFKELLDAFPNSYELKKYTLARISAVLSSYLDTKEDYEEKYHKYLNKKVSKKGRNVQYEYSDIELWKYQGLLQKLKLMLDDNNSYNENQWQAELIQIILFLYPKYIYVFKEAPIIDTYNKKRRIDYLLVDSNGNTDIIEIKKPFCKCIVTERRYRDNYIPLRELSGAVMQVEKYIFYLNKYGSKGEEKLTSHYKEDIADNFKIKITNPCGIIIMGRTKGLSKEQIQDFEVIKRKYKSIIDILTYDDLIKRFEFIIMKWKKLNTTS